MVIMNRQRGGSFINKFAIFLSLLLVATAVLSMVSRSIQTAGGADLKLIAAELALPQGNISADKVTANSVSGQKQKNEEQIQEENSSPDTIKTAAETAKKNDEKEEKDINKNTFPIIESQFGASGTSYDNFHVKNSTNYVMNFGQLLSAPLGFEMENTSEPQVLIVHTHTTEAYVEEDLGYYYEGQEFRSTTDSKNILQVGEAIVNTLHKNGIGAVHAKEYHDDPAYNGSYDRSEQTIYKYMEQYPSIKVVIDIHRDSIGYDDERGKIKPTFVAKGKKAAQIMILSGYDPYNDYGFPEWESNLKFALRLQQKAETMYPGMTRPLYFGDFAYNMFINPGSLLIEMGTEVNTLEEAVYSGELLGDVLSSVLKP